MGGTLYPALRAHLTEAGCRFVRQGKGLHEVWHSPLTDRTFTALKNTVVRHAANAVLKDAGLPKSF